jgi:phosphatidylglycerol:prolipoprotein diacylglycerol transferase
MRLGYDPWLIFAWLAAAFPIGALSARLLAGWVAHDLRAPEPSWFNSGMTMLGSVLACFGFSTAYIALIWREPPWRLLDAAAFTFPLATLFGRLGCLLNGCCVGSFAPHRSPLAMMLSIPCGSFAEGTRAADLCRSVEAGSRVWNLPLFLILAASASLGVSVWLVRRKEARGWPEGSVILGTLAVDSLFRFFVEFSRQDRVVGALPFNPWQLITAGTGLVALLIMWGRFRIMRSEQPR